MLNRPFIRRDHSSPAGIRRQPARGGHDVHFRHEQHPRLGNRRRYLTDTKNEQTLANKWAKTNPQVQSDIAYFQAQAPKLTTVDALMKDYRSLQVVLGAFNVSDLLTSPALTRQLLTQDPASSSSTVQKIGNPAYQIFANAFNQFQNNPLGNSAGVTSVVNSYVENSSRPRRTRRPPACRTRWPSPAPPRSSPPSPR